MYTTMERKLANGMTITCQNESKKLAADRWLVKFRYRAAIPLQGWMQEAMAGSDPKTVYCREQLGEGLIHEFVMERNFIDEAEKDRLLAEIIERHEEAVLGYLSKETFVRRLFRLQLTEISRQYVQQGWVERTADGDEVPEPADFSACFR